MSQSATKTDEPDAVEHDGYDAIDRAPSRPFSEPGIYEVAEAVYHRDPAPTPSLSASIAKLIVNRSPKHAWQNHPRLGGGEEADDEADEPNAAMDDGSALHKMILGVGAPIERIMARYEGKHERAGEIVTDWRTKAAKEARESARAAGRIPMLSHRLDQLRGIADIARTQMQAHPACKEFFDAGRSEQMLMWREGPVWCRSLIDRMPDDPSAPLFDLKTTGLSAAPAEWERRVEMEYAIQAAFYLRGSAALRGGVVPDEFRFVVIETKAPYCVSVMAPDPSLIAIAEQDVKRAVLRWNKCTMTGEWPGYPPFTYIVTPSVRTSMLAEERRMADAQRSHANDDSRGLDALVGNGSGPDWGG